MEVVEGDFCSSEMMDKKYDAKFLDSFATRAHYLMENLGTSHAFDGPSQGNTSCTIEGSDFLHGEEAHKNKLPLIECRLFPSFFLWLGCLSSFILFFYLILYL